MRRICFGVVGWLLLTAGVALAEMPHGWTFSSTAPQAYVAGVDRQVFHSGRASGFLRSSVGASQRDYAIMLQHFDADKYRRRRVRMSGWMRSESVSGWAGMWLRIDPHHGAPLEFDNMQDRPIVGTTPWRQYSIELSVPQEGDKIHFGMLLAGGGEVWLDDVSFEPLGEALPGARERQRLRGPEDPVNLDFEN